MAQSGLGQQQLNKCAHDACVCTVEPGQTYCSDFCASVSAVKTSAELPARHMNAGGQCECGHDACERVHARGTAQPNALPGSAPGERSAADIEAQQHEAARKAFQNTGED